MVDGLATSCVIVFKMCDTGYPLETGTFVVAHTSPLIFCVKVNPHGAYILWRLCTNGRLRLQNSSLMLLKRIYPTERNIQAPTLLLLLPMPRLDVSVLRLGRRQGGPGDYARQHDPAEHGEPDDSLPPALLPFPLTLQFLPPRPIRSLPLPPRVEPVPQVVVRAIVRLAVPVLVAVFRIRRGVGVARPGGSRRSVRRVRRLRCLLPLAPVRAPSTLRVEARRRAVELRATSAQAGCRAAAGGGAGGGEGAPRVFGGGAEVAAAQAAV